MEQETPIPVALGSVDDVGWEDGSEDLSDLLGFDFAGEEGTDRSGLRALINSAIISHRRLPMLDVIFDRTARKMSTSLRQFTDENVEVALEDVTSIRFGDFIQNQNSDVVIGVVRSATLDGYFLIAVDGTLIYSIVDLLLGGRMGGYANEENGRRLTPIELGLAQRMLTLLVSSFGESFKVVRDVDLSLQRIETTPRFAAIVQEPSVCAIAKFRVRIAGWQSRLSIVAPHASIESVKEVLLRDFVGDAEGADQEWRSHIEKEAVHTDIDLNVIIGERIVRLKDIADMKVGGHFDLAISPSSDVEIKAGNVSVGTGRVGRAHGKLAVKLGKSIDETQLRKQIESEPLRPAAEQS